MNIQWHLRKDTQTCEWSFQLTEGSFRLVMSLPEFFNLIKALNTTCQQIGTNMIGDMNVADAIAEVERLLKAAPGKGEKQGKPVVRERMLRDRQGGIVGEVDKDYEIADGRVVFDEVLLKGIWPPPDNELVYNGVKLHVESVVAHIGLLVDEKGARGPAIQGVKCKVEA